MIVAIIGVTCILSRFYTFWWVYRIYSKLIVIYLLYHGNVVVYHLCNIIIIANLIFRNHGSLYKKKKKTVEYEIIFIKY